MSTPIVREPWRRYTRLHESREMQMARFVVGTPAPETHSAHGVECTYDRVCTHGYNECDPCKLGPKWLAKEKAVPVFSMPPTDGSHADGMQHAPVPFEPSPLGKVPDYDAKQRHADNGGNRYSERAGREWACVPAADEAAWHAHCTKCFKDHGGASTVMNRRDAEECCVEIEKAQSEWRARQNYHYGGAVATPLRKGNVGHRARDLSSKRVGAALAKLDALGIKDGDIRF